MDRSQGERAKDVVGETLLSVLLLESLFPEGRGQVQDAALGPARQQAEQVPQVGPGLDAVELAAGQQRDEGGVDLGGFVVADEEPVLPADRRASVILPMSHFVRASSIRGTRRRASKSTCSTASSAAALARLLLDAAKAAVGREAPNDAS